MVRAKKSADYSAEIKEAKKIAKEALSLGKKIAAEAKAKYDSATPANKKKIKKAAVIGALSLVGLMSTKAVAKKVAANKRCKC